MSVNITTLPPGDREELTHFFQVKLHSASQVEQDLSQRLAQVRQTIKTYKDLLSQIDSSAVASLSNTPQDIPFEPVLEAEEEQKVKLQTRLKEQSNKIGNQASDAYNADGWTHAEKILYVLDRPEKYGFDTFLGASAVTDAILVEEQALGRNTSKDDLKNIAPTISRLIARGEVFKYLEEGSLSKYHFVTASWFDQSGMIKPQYRKSVENLQLPAEKKSATVGAVADAEMETNKVEPSVDAEETFDGLISLPKRKLELF